MKQNPIAYFFTLTVQLLLLLCVLASPANAVNSGKTALGGSQPSTTVALENIVGKSLRLLDIFLDFKTKALGCCVGPDANLTAKVDGKNAALKQDKIFTKTENYQAPKNETGINYTIFQQNIDPNLKIEVKNPRTGEIRITTNSELMKNGKAPYVIKDGKPQRIELHHSRQNANGPLFETSTSTHKAKTGQGGKALHPYKTKLGQSKNGEGSAASKKSHPTNPVERAKFDKDREQYYKDRIKKILDSKKKKAEDAPK